MMARPTCADLAKDQLRAIGGLVVPAQAGTQEVSAGHYRLDSRLRGNDEAAVVPAQAGTQEISTGHCLLDSRLRGNDESAVVAAQA